MMSVQSPESLPPPPQRPMGHSPLRRPHSIRRTASIDMTWPQGRRGQLHLIGRARDIYTPRAGGEPVVLAEDGMRAGTTRRAIDWIETDTTRADVSVLVGEQAGGFLRTTLEARLPQERDAGTPLYLLLDDLAGATLIAGWVWTQWTDDRKDPEQHAHRAALRQRLEGVCTGFRPGSSALLAPDGTYRLANASRVIPLPHPDDPDGWHPMIHVDGIAMRRARRIDVWLDDLIRIDSMFQDSATTPDGGRMAVHEYHLTAVADPKTMTLVAVKADPRTLPYAECPSAVNNIQPLIGTPLVELRARVSRLLRKTAGCTHLNDALRALAEVPRLVASLPDPHHFAGDLA